MASGRGAFIVRHSGVSREGCRLVTGAHSECRDSPERGRVTRRHAIAELPGMSAAIERQEGGRVVKGRARAGRN